MDIFKITLKEQGNQEDYFREQRNMYPPGRAYLTCN